MCGDRATRDRVDAAQPAVLLVGLLAADHAAGGGGRRHRAVRRRLRRHAGVVRRGHRRVHALRCAVSTITLI